MIPHIRTQGIMPLYPTLSITSKLALLFLHHHVLSKSPLGATMSHGIASMTLPCFFLEPLGMQGDYP